FPSFNVVTANFFATSGLRFLRGTTFDEHAPTVVVNDAMARLVWPGRDALGQCLYLTQRESGCYPVTRVVETARRSQLIEAEALPLYYIPLAFGHGTGIYGNVVIGRTVPGAEQAAVSALRAALRKAFPSGDVWVQTMDETMDYQYRPWRL